MTPSGLSKVPLKDISESPTMAQPIKQLTLQPLRGATTSCFPPPSPAQHEDLDHCLPSFLSDQVKDRLFWFHGFKPNKKGGLIFLDKETLKKQQGVVKDVMVQLGSQLLSGKLGVRLSLPIRLFEPRSLLERVAESWLYAPTVLAKAAATENAVERMQHIMAFVVGGLHCCVNQNKPFNPILGETYQATLADGTIILLEHIK